MLLKDLRVFYNKHNEALKICTNPYDQEIFKKNKESFEKSLLNRLNIHLLEDKNFNEYKIISLYGETYKIQLKDNNVFIIYKDHITTIKTDGRVNALEWYAYLNKDNILTIMVSKEEIINISPTEYMENISGKSCKRPIEQIIEFAPNYIY